MDAFYVSVELLRRPELRGRPVVVGGDGPRGVVAAASYEARRYGVRSAMPSVRARRLCPGAVFLPGDHEHYAAVSRDVHAVLAALTPVVEPVALDEAFCDLTGTERRLGAAPAVAEGLRRRLHGELGLWASVGVASCKLLAKLASEAAKPSAGPAGVRAGRGVVVIDPPDELAFLHPHPVEALWGVGPATLARLQSLQVRTVGDLAAVPVSVLVASLGEAHGRHLHRLAHGIDERPVEADRTPKSVGQETTFAEDRTTYEACATEVVRLADAATARLRAAGMVARTVTLKVRFADFRTITRSVTLPRPVSAGPAVARAASTLLAAVEGIHDGVRLLGVSVSGLVPVAEVPPEQLSLPGLPVPPSTTDRDADPDRAAPRRVATAEPGPDLLAADRQGADEHAWEAASGAVDEVRRRFGPGAIGPAAALGRRRGSPWGPAPVE